MYTKKITAITLAAAMCLPIAGVAQEGITERPFIITKIEYTSKSADANKGRYADVSKTDWHYPYVERLSEAGAINGMPDGSFYPENDISRAEFVKIVTEAMPTTEVSSEGRYLETDHWAKSFIAKAEDNKLLNAGEYATDTWDQPIQRREMAQIVSRAMTNVAGEPAEADTAPYIARIKDWNDQCDTCKPDIAQAYAKGVINGMPDGSFQGFKTATRAEATTMIIRLIDPEYRTVYYGDIPFNAKTSVNEKGIMNIDNAELFMMYVVEHMEFYKENGKYYVKASYPELPEGFEMGLDMYFEFKNGPLADLTTSTVYHEFADRVNIPKYGSFDKEIWNMQSPDNIVKSSITVWVNKTDGLNSERNEGYLGIWINSPNKIGIVNTSAGASKQKNLEYDFTKIFKW